MRRYLYNKNSCQYSLVQKRWLRKPPLKASLVNLGLKPPRILPDQKLL